MARRVLGWALVLVVAWTARPAAAQSASPLKAVPGNAAVIVRVKAFQGTLDKIAKLSDAVSEGSGQMIKLGGGMIGTQIQNPTLEGVDIAGDFYIAAFIEKDAAPGILMVVPAKDADAMEEALGDEFTFLKQDKYGIYSKDEDLVNAVKKQVAARGKGSAAEAIDAKSLDVFNRGDISVFVNVPALLDVYKDEFAQLKEQSKSVKDITPAGGASANVNVPALMGQLQQLVDILVQAVEDHQGISIALNVTDKDLVIEEFFKLRVDSVSGKALKAGTGSDLALLNNLPSDNMGYYAVQCDFNKLTAWGMEFMKAAITDQKSLDALNGVMADLKNLKVTGMAGSVNLNKSAEGALSMVNLIGTSDPKKLRSIYQKSANAMKQIEANGTKTELTYNPDAEKINGNSIDLITSKVTISDDAPDAENQRRIIKTMYGEQGPSNRTAFLKDKVVQTTGGGKPAMEAALKAAETPTRTPAAAVQAVRSKLGAKSSFIGLLDVASLALKSMALSKDFGRRNLPFDPEKIASGLTLKPSYIGFGVEVQEAAVSLKTVIPVDQMKNIGQIVKKAMTVTQQGDN